MTACLPAIVFASVAIVFGCRFASFRQPVDGLLLAAGVLALLALVNGNRVYGKRTSDEQ